MPRSPGQRCRRTGRFRGSARRRCACVPRAALDFRAKEPRPCHCRHVQRVTFLELRRLVAEYTEALTDWLVAFGAIDLAGANVRPPCRKRAALFEGSTHRCCLAVQSGVCAGHESRGSGRLSGECRGNERHQQPEGHHQALQARHGASLAPTPLCSKRVEGAASAPPIAPRIR